MDGDTLMMIPTDILAPRPRRGRLLGRMTENALFWAVLVLLGIGAVTSFYYEQQITAAAPDKAHESVSALPDATRPAHPALSDAEWAADGLSVMRPFEVRF